MNLLVAIASLVEATLPDYPADRVDAVAAAMGEPVLWAGRAHSAHAVSDTALGAAWFALLALLSGGVMLSALARGRHAHARSGGEGPWAPAATFLPALALGTACLAGLGWAQGTASSQAAKGVVVSQSGMTVVSADARVEVPAASIHGILREGRKVAVRIAGEGEIRLPPEASESDAFDRALRSVAGRMASR